MSDKIIYQYDGGDGEISSYVSEQVGEHNSVVLTRDPSDKYWTDIARGVSCGSITDDGNGIVLEIDEFHMGLTGSRKEIDLNYSEAVEAFLLLQAYLDTSDANRPNLKPTAIRKFKELK